MRNTRHSFLYCTRVWLCLCAGGLAMLGYGQGDASGWRDELYVMGEGGIVWRRPEVVGAADRISTGVHTDGYWGLGARVALRNTVVSLGWSRHKQSVYYVINDKGRTTSKRTMPSLAYTSLPVRVGQRFPVWHRRVHVMPYLAFVWSFTDESEGVQYTSSGNEGRLIDGNTGDTVETITRLTPQLLARTTFTLGPGLELGLTVGRWTAIAGMEYLWSTANSLEYAVAYSRTSTLSGDYHEKATIRLTPKVLAMRWGLLFRVRKERTPAAGNW